MPRAVPDISASAARSQSLQTTEGTAESFINQSETERIVLTLVSAGGVEVCFHGDKTGAEYGSISDDKNKSVNK